MARPSWRPADIRTLGAKRSGAPELAPFLQRSGGEEPACRRGKKEACEGFGCGTAAIGRCAISRESSPSGEGDRPSRRAPFHHASGVSAYASPLAFLAIQTRLLRLATGSVSKPSRGPDAGYQVEAGAIRRPRRWRMSSRTVQRKRTQERNLFATWRLNPCSARSQIRRCAPPLLGRKCPFCLPSKRARNAGNPASWEAGPMIQSVQSPLRRDQIRLKSSSPSTLTSEA